MQLQRQGFLLYIPTSLLQAALHKELKLFAALMVCLLARVIAGGSLSIQNQFGDSAVVGRRQNFEYAKIVRWLIHDAACQRKHRISMNRKSRSQQFSYADRYKLIRDSAS